MATPSRPRQNLHVKHSARGHRPDPTIVATTTPDSDSPYLVPFLHTARKRRPHSTTFDPPKAQRKPSNDWSATSDQYTIPNEAQRFERDVHCTPEDGAHTINGYAQQRQTSQDSQEIQLSKDATRASMLDGMLSNLNDSTTPQQDTYTEASYSPPSSNAQFIPGIFGRSHSESRSLGETPSSLTPKPPSPPRVHPSSPIAVDLFDDQDSRASYDKRSDSNASGATRAKPASANEAQDKQRIPVKPARESKTARHSPVAMSDIRVASGAMSGTSRRLAHGGDGRPGSPPGNSDLNPQDLSSRRRSQSFNAAVTRSVLDRARPVPAEYHTFHDATNRAENEALQKTLTNPTQSDTSNQYAPARMPTVVPTGAAPRAHADPNTGDGRIRLGTAGSYVSQASSMGPSSRQPSSSFPPNMQPSDMSSGDAYGASYRGSMKERPGFFKRMFASSKGSSATVNPSQEPPQLPPVTLERRRRVVEERMPIDTNNQTSQNEQVAVGDTTNVPVTITEGNQRPPQTLHNKRSFFRRRRKTTAEDKQAMSSRDGSVHNRSDHPSMSSLRKVMDPYLAKEQAPKDEYFDSLEAQPVIRRHQREDTQASSQAASPRRVQPAKRRGGSRDEVVRGAPRNDGHQPSTSVTKITDTQTPIMSEPVLAEAYEPVTNQYHLHNGDPGPSIPSTLPAGDDGRAAQLGAARSAHHENDTITSSTLKHQQSPTPIDINVANAQTDKWLLHAPADDGKASSINSNRVFIQEDASNEALVEPGSSLAREGTPQSLGQARAARSENSLPNEDYASARSMPIVQVEGQEESVVITPPPMSEDSPRALSEVEQRDIERAKKIWEAQNDPLTRDYGALELGESGETGDRLRIAFMAFFDFSGLNILLALRDLCGRMTLKGETQQMDRIMSAFSERWCECNPNHGFKNEDVVHTICYSLLLLNTDLHVADLAEKMTRTQFVKNTVPTLRKIAEAGVGGPGPTAAHTWPDRGHGRGSFTGHPPPRSPSPSSTLDVRPSIEDRSTSSRLSNKRMLRPTSDVPSFVSPGPYDVHAVDASELLVNSPQEGNLRTWEIALETVLKEFYLSIRQLRLPLHGATDVQLHEQPSSQSLSVMGTFMRRTGSIVSKAPSEDSRGRGPNARSVASRWASKTRSRPRLYPASTFSSSYSASRTSLEDTGPWSPAASSTWSKSFGNTQTSMSTDSLSSRLAHTNLGYQQSIGFANALSHAIIREEGFTNPDEGAEGGPAALLEDESLELAGAPWAKEGIVQHKHHLETTDKKAKDRNWSECFAVVEKGVLRLFSFNTSKSSMRSQKSSKGSSGGKAAPVGGGNWMDNAQAVGNFTLRQTIANTLPPPGYSKVRPHVFALSLPTGAVHLFQVGTPEIAREFVTTANYWSARLSKEPLVGGVSNVEYGWGDSVINTALLNSSTNTSSAATHGPGSSASARSIQTTHSASNPPSSFHIPRTESSMSAPPGRGSTHHSHRPSGSLSSAPSPRSSLQGSLRSSFDAPTRSAAFRARPSPADRLALAEWTPPQQSLMASSLSAAAQLEALRRYVRSVEEELERHNELRAAVVVAFSPRGANSARALANWERKSSHLLREIVKFRTYVDVLGVAEVEARRVRGERGAAGAGEVLKEAGTGALNAGAGVGGGGGDDDGNGNGNGNEKGRIRLVSHAKKESVDEQEFSEETLEALRGAKLGGRVRSGTNSTGG